MKLYNAETADQLSDEEKATIETLLKYPSLEKVFDSNQPHNLLETKRKMQSTLVELERVIRSGTQSDADKATRIAAAYRKAIDFLEELELLRKNQTNLK